MKKVFSLVLFVILTVAVSVTAFAADSDIIASGYCGGEGDGTNLEWVLTEDGTLTISGTGKMEEFKEYRVGNSSIGDTPWRIYMDQITSLVLNEGMTNIGDYAFLECKNISGSLVIPDSVISIGWGAFAGCSGLDGKLVLGENLEELESSVFSGCNFVGKLVLPEKLRIIGPFSLRSNSFAGNLVIPESVTEIGQDAFAGCSGFTGNLVIPDNVKKLGYQTFRLCSGLTGTLTLGKNLEYIDDHVFDGCNFSGELVIPESVTHIGKFAFYSQSFTGDLVIGDGVKEIGDYAFYGNSGFDKLILGAKLKSIGSYAFSRCGFKNGLIIPNSVTKIGTCAFSGSKFNGKLVLSENLSVIQENVFSNCGGLFGELVIPESIISISNYAFYGCNDIEKVTFEKGIEVIGNEAFTNCSKIKGFYFKGAAPIVTAAESNSRSFDSNKVLYYGEGKADWTSPKYCGYSTATWEIPYEKYSVVYDANGGKNSPAEQIKIEDEDFVLSSEIPEREGYVFLGWAKDPDAKSADYEAGGIYSGNESVILYAVWIEKIIASGYCGGEGDGTNLSWTLTEDGTLTISGEGEMADYEDGKLENGQWAVNSPWYQYRNDIYSIKIEEGITRISDYAFSGAYETDGKVTIPESVMSIGDYAFQSVAEGSVTIPSAVIEIGNSPFANCIYLEEINVAKENQTFCSVDGKLYSKDMKTLYAWPNLRNEKTAVVPEGVTTIATGAFDRLVGKNMNVDIILPETVKILENDTFIVNGRVMVKGQLDFVSTYALSPWGGSLSFYFFNGPPKEASKYAFDAEADGPIGLYYLSGTEDLWNFDENGLWNGYEVNEYSGYGDLNSDFTVDVKDVYLARLAAAKLVVPTEEEFSLGDVDGNGRINAIDANLIRKFCANIITKFPVGG